MSRNIKVEVNSIRVDESSDNPILLLLDPSTQKSFTNLDRYNRSSFNCLCSRRILHDRPQTHDLLIDIVEVLEGSN